MKHLFFTIVLVLAAAISSFAAPITISSANVPNYPYKGTTARIRIFSNQRFITSDSKVIMQSSTTSNTWYKEVNCAVVGNTLVIPEILLDSTTDSSNPSATYVAYLYDYSNVRRDTWISNFRVPHNLGSPITWTQILTYNSTAPNPPPPGYYTNDQVNTLIAGALTNVLLSNSPRLEKDLSLFSNSLQSAVTSIGATETVLNIMQPVTVPATLAVPKNIHLRITGEGSITVAAGQTLTINSFSDPGNRKVFTSSAAGARILFGKGTVKKINVAWWTGQSNNSSSPVDATDAIAEAVATSVANMGGAIYLPEGYFSTSGGHILGDSTIIEGAGTFPNAGYGGTYLKLVGATGDYMFKIGQGEFGIRFRDIALDGTGTTGKTAVLLEGTAPNTSGDLAFSSVALISFAIGVNQNSLGGDWQFAQIKFDHCYFQNNQTAIKMNSVNGQFFINSSYFSIPVNGWAFDARNSGPLTVTGSEFGGTWGTGIAGDCGIIKYTGQHREVNFVNNQDESCRIFIQNDASDNSSITNIIGSLIQGKILLNQSGTVNSFGSTYLSHAFRDAPGVASRVTSRGDYVRPNIVDDGVTLINPPRLDNFVGGSIIVTEENANTDFIKKRLPSRFLSPKIWDGYATVPQVGIGHYSEIAESKILLRLGRVNASETFDFYYDFWRQNSGDDAGRMKLRGNQTGFAGLDLENGDLFAQGAIRNQSVQLTDGATISLDPRTGNYFHVTLGGNRTFTMGALSVFEKNRADGQSVTVEIKQDATGSRTLTLSSGAGQFAFSTQIPTVTLSTTANKTDLLTAQYSARLDRWLIVDFKTGF